MRLAGDKLATEGVIFAPTGNMQANRGRHIRQRRDLFGVAAAAGIAPLPAYHAEPPGNGQDLALIEHRRRPMKARESRQEAI